MGNRYKCFYSMLIILISVLVFTGCDKSSGESVISGVENTLTPVVATVLAQPVPVRGSDGLYYLIYELFLTNSNTFDWDVISIDVLENNDEGNLIFSLSGEELAGRMQQVGTHVQTTTLEPVQSGLVFITLSFENAEDIPANLVHRLTITGPDGLLPEFIISFLQLPEDQDTLPEIAGKVEVNNQDVIVLGPPLEGTGWVVANGCCNSETHMRTALPVNGKIRISQRFAIDWLKISEDNRLFVGDPQVLENWFGYNQNILAVGDAQVVLAVDKFEDQVPFVLPTEAGAITLDGIDGNNVVLALENGQFAFYAHLKPGSVTVEAGDFVKKGDVIGLLGNTGNTSAPHLHLHIMETASSLGSNGLPYVFESYNLIGQTTDESFFDDGLEDTTPFVDEETGLIIGNSIDVLPVNTPGPHSNDLPLDLRIVEFPSN